MPFQCFRCVSVVFPGCHRHVPGLIRSADPPIRRAPEFTGLPFTVIELAYFPQVACRAEPQNPGSPEPERKLLWGWPCH